MAAERIAMQYFLHLQGQAWLVSAPIVVTRLWPHTLIRWKSDHARLSAEMMSAMRAACAGTSTRILSPLLSSTAMTSPDVMLPGVRLVWRFSNVIDHAATASNSSVSCKCRQHVMRARRTFLISVVLVSSLTGRYSGCCASISINASSVASILLHSERLCSAIAVSASVAAS